jgi:hypothetical protein
MRQRQAASTTPETYTAGEVAKIFPGEISAQNLGNWDEKDWFRPSFYADTDAPGGVITPAERNDRPRNQGAPERRYSFTDLLWLGIFVHAKRTFERTGVANAAKRASTVVKALRDTDDVRIPARSRLLFLEGDAYVLEDSGEVRPLPPAKQLALTGLFGAEVAAELRGRLEVLSARSEIHSPASIDNAIEDQTGT